MLNSKGKERKKEIYDCLYIRDREKIIKWAQKSSSALRLLFPFTYNSNELVHWRAIEAIGIASKELYKNDIEKLRYFIRNLIWLMNDESGGLAWHAPETIAEILYNVPPLQKEYAKLLPQYLDEESFKKGTLYALIRLQESNPELIIQSSDTLVISLSDSDPVIRGLALVSLKSLHSDFYKDFIRIRLNDHAKVPIYNFENGSLYYLTISQIAQESSGSKSTIMNLNMINTFNI